MAQKNTIQESTSDALNGLRKHAITLMGILITLLLKKEDFIELYNNDTFLFLLTSLLVIFSVLWFYAFYMGGLQEQRWMTEYLKADIIPSLGLEVYLVALSLVISFVVLIYNSDNIVVFTGAITFLCFVDLWSIHVLRYKIFKSIEVSLLAEKTENGNNIGGVKILHTYYFGYFWSERVGTTMLLNCIAFFIAALSEYYPDENSRLYTILAYLIVLTVNITSVAIHGYYRNQTFKKLKKLAN